MSRGAPSKRMNLSVRDFRSKPRLGKSAKRLRLGLQQITSPSATASEVYLAVVQAMFAVRPELDRVGTYAKPGPARRERDFRGPLNFLASRAHRARVPHASEAEHSDATRSQQAGSAAAGFQWASA